MRRQGKGKKKDWVGMWGRLVQESSRILPPTVWSQKQGEHNWTILNIVLLILLYRYSYTDTFLCAAFLCSTQLPLTWRHTKLNLLSASSSTLHMLAPNAAKKKIAWFLLEASWLFIVSFHVRSKKLANGWPADHCVQTCVGKVGFSFRYVQVSARRVPGVLALE